MSQNWKTVRVFISSTFRDMQAERDHLLRVVFPELKERLRKRRVQLIDVDLRWGVTEEQAEGGGALDICLDTIDSCRPYFLGLLGQRYGYIPPGQTHSITAREIYHGVLHDNLPRQLADLRPFAKGNLEGRELDKEQVDCLVRCYQWNQERSKYLLKEDITPEEVKTIRSIFYGYSIYQKDRSFFFFRSETLTRELAGAKVDDYFEADEGVRAKLARLKQEIISAGLPHFEYEDLETFGQNVLETLWERISAEFPEEREEAKRDWLKEEEEFHELFIADRTRWFVGRADILKRMQTFVEDDPDSQVMAIAGEPGCGKSALMARFTEQIMRSHPDWLILPHFVGASPSSTSLRHTLRRLCAELNRALGLTGEVPEGYKELAQLFPELLQRAAESRRVLLIVDALNQFERSDNAHTMTWLPQQPPLNVKVVVSTLAGEALDALKAWRIQPRFEELGELTELETELFVANYLREIRKEFPTPEIRDAFHDKVKAGHPLYILVALEELRVFPVYEEMRKRVASLPETVPEMFDQMLERIEGDFNRALVQDFVSFIACGRQGMTGEELQELLGKYAPVVGSEGLAPKFPDMLFSRLRRAFSAYLFERSGVIDFFHGQLKEAVGRRYLQAESDRVGVHRIIAEYFERRWREPYLRALDELPHQLTKAKEWDGVERVLCDLHFVEAKCVARMTYDLVNDYNVAIRALPEAQLEMQEKLKYELRLRKYTEDLIAYAKGEIGHLEIVPSVEPWSEEKIRRDTDRAINNPMRLDRIRAFSQFVNSESYALLKFASYPGFTVQQAYNSARNGPVASAAESIISAEMGNILLLHHASQRPEYNPRPALLTTLEGHSDFVRYVSVTPDGKLAVSASADKTLKVWNLESGACLRTLQGHTDCVWCVGVTPDGKTAVSASKDRTLKVWDVDSGECTKTLQGHTSAVLSVSVTSDGKLAVSASADKTLKVWNLESGECLRTLQGHTDWVRCVGLTSAGKIAVSGSDDRTLKVWDVESGECLRTLQGHTDCVWCVGATPDGKTVISGSMDIGAKVIVGDDKSTPIREAAKGWETTKSESTLKVWDVESGECIKTLEGHTGPVVCVGMTPDGKTVISASLDKAMRIGLAANKEILQVWDVESEECTKILQGHTSTVLSVSLTPDGRIAVSGSDDRTLKVWDVESGECLRTLQGHTSYVECVGVAPDGKLAVSASKDRTVKVWDVESGECLRTLQGHTSDVEWVGVTPDGKLAVSASWDEALKVWDVDSGEYIKTLWGHTHLVECVGVTPDGKLAVSASWDRTLKVWDVDSGEYVKTLEGHTSSVERVGLTPDGKLAVSASADKTLKVWNLESGACLRTLQGHTACVTCVSVTPDGKLAVSGSDDQTVKVWNLESGECIKTLEGHTSSVVCVGVAPDGKLAVSGSVDKTLKVWNLESGECTAIYQTNGKVYSISDLSIVGHFVTGIECQVIFIAARNLVVKTPFVTPVRLRLHKKELSRLFGKEKVSVCWDDNITVACQWCGKRFPVPEEKLELIRSIDRNANLSPDQSPCLKLPSEAWKEPRLFFECPICHKPLKLNPFIVDNSLKREKKDSWCDTDSKQSQDEFNARQWFRKGNELRNLGRHEDAIKCYDKTLEIQGRDADTWKNKGISLLLLGRYAEAIKCYDKALEINPQDKEAWFNKGSFLDNLGGYDEAIKCYDKSLEINPKHADTWNNKGNSLVRLGRYEEAIKCYDKALEINPQHAMAWLNKGLAESRLGLRRDAATSYRRLIELALEKDAKYVEVARERLQELEGGSLSSLDRLDEARQGYGKASQINQQDADAWNSKGVSLDNLGRYEEAIKCYNKALEINPQDASAWFNKGGCLISLGLYNEALECCGRAVEIDPRYAWTWFNKGAAEYQLGLKRDAAISYRRFIELAPPQEARYTKYIEIARNRLRELEGR